MPILLFPRPIATFVRRYRINRHNYYYITFILWVFHQYYSLIALIITQSISLSASFTSPILLSIRCSGPPAVQPLRCHQRRLSDYFHRPPRSIRSQSISAFVIISFQIVRNYGSSYASGSSRFATLSPGVYHAYAFATITFSALFHGRRLRSRQRAST